MRWPVAVFACTLGVPDADACTLIGDARFMPADMPTEQVAPSPPVISRPVVTVSRADDGCNAPNDSCGSIGRIDFHVEASDDTTATGLLGYRLRVVSGTSPGLGELYDRSSPNGSLGLYFNVSEDEVNFDFELGVSAIDASGNVGPQGVVRITYREGGGGCSTRRPASKLVIALATAGLLLRRRRTRC